MIDFIKRVHPLRLAPVSPDMDLFVEAACQELPFLVHEYQSGLRLNDWIIPQSWEVKKCRVDGKDITHPLAVWGYSNSGEGNHLQKKGLTKEVFPYHWEWYYHPEICDWGVWMPSGFHHIELETEKKPGKMYVLEYTIHGRSDATVVFHAHNCHAAQANDDMSGVAVGMQVMKRIKSFNGKHDATYTLLVSPEIYGPLFWMNGMNDLNKEIDGTIKLASLGGKGSLVFQKPALAQNALYMDYVNEFTTFRKVHGNDETVFEAYGIPSGSLTRYPFPEYHTSLDTPERLSPYHLKASVWAIESWVQDLEKGILPVALFTGLPRLNYRRLYRPPNDPLHDLMNLLPTYMMRKQTVKSIAANQKLDYYTVLNYIKEWEEAGLVRLPR